MRSDPLDSVGSRSASPVGGGRLVDRFGPIGRWLRGRRGAPWRVAALAIAASLAAAGSMAVLSPGDPGVSYLDGGRSFAPDEVESLLKSLQMQGIAARDDGRGRVGVDPDRLAEALKVVDQQGLGRRSLIQEFDDPDRPSLLADSAERAEILLRAEAKKVERALDEVPGIGSAVVVLKSRPGRPALAFSRPEVAGAGVRLRAEDGRAISPTTVEQVLNVVTTFTALDSEAVTVIDAQGNALLKAGDRGSSRSMRAEALARSWEAAIAEDLGRIVEGARVEVRLDAPGMADGAESDRGEASMPARTVVAVVPNGPMSLDRPPAPLSDADAADADPPIRANVLVQVPASYYLARHDAFAGGRESGREVLDRLVAFTEDSIRAIVAHVVPGESLGRLQILMLPLPDRGPAAAGSTPSRGERAVAWWAPAVVVGLGAALALLAAAGGWLPGLRPSPRAAVATPAASRPHLPALRDDDAPGPADRVRELVRRDPAAAAAVLRRWVEQGADA